MREVKLTLSKYLEEKKEAALEREFAEVMRRLSEMTLSKVKKGEREFCISLTMTPQTYEKMMDEGKTMLNFEHINPDKINFKSSKPQCFKLKYAFKLF